VQREYFKSWSKCLGREMELLTFGHAGARVLVFPTRCGRFYDYENFGMLESVRERVENGWIQLYCVDSIDHESLYCRDSHPRDRVQRHQLFEDYVLTEVLPFSEQRNPGSFLLAHGCSLGAFHAINIACRHPDLFGKAVGFSGRYALTQAVGEFFDLFDGYSDELVYLHSPLSFLAGAHDSAHLEQLRKLEITIAVGEADPFLDSNRVLSNTLSQIGIKHQLHVWQRRAHGRRSWQQMSQCYL
jgi:esterase/lipase superfamily enzyme